MNKRLIVIIVVGSVTIAAAYFFMHTPDESAPPALVQSSTVKPNPLETLETSETATTAEAPHDSQSATQTPVSEETPTSTQSAVTQPSSTQTTIEKATDSLTATPQTPLIIPSTEREAAKLLARASTTKDPFSAVLLYKPFPSSTATPANDQMKTASTSDKTKPPSQKDGLTKHHKVPPPPPGFAAPPPAVASIDVGQLPFPPAPPTIADKFKVVGIIGDKAILACTDLSVRHEYKWSKMITVASGDILGPVTVIDVKSDSVTLEEDGNRTERELSPVR